MNGSDWGQFLIDEADKAKNAGRTIVRLVALQPGGFAVDDAVDLAGRRFPVTVELANITFTGRVDLAESRFDASLNVDACTFEQGLVLRDARIDGNCRLRSCEFEDKVYKFLDFRRLHVTGRLNLACSTSHVGIDLTSLTCEDEVRLDGLHATATIKKRSDIDLPPDAAPGLLQHLGNFMIGVAVQMRGADIRRDLLLFEIDGRPTKLTGSADFRAKVGMSVTFSGAVVDAGKGSKAVNMDAADVGGTVFFQNGTHLTGYVDLRAKVGGHVNFDNATVIAEPGSRAVDMGRADVGKSVFFRNGTHLTGYVNLRAKVGGQVAFDNATVLAKPGSMAVNMNAADISGSVFFR
ncbi:MAG: pentapeptide repeat-containing protein, partial [Planctomycetota bacterium]